MPEENTTGEFSLPPGPSPHGDPLVGALTDVSISLERFSGRLEAQEKTVDELRGQVTRALEVAAKRNSTLDRIEIAEQRRADAAERAATAEAERLAIETKDAAERKRTASARWEEIKGATVGFVKSVLSHPVTVAIGGALIFGIAQTIASVFGFNVSDYMQAGSSGESTPVHAPVPVPLPRNPEPTE